MKQTLGARIAELRKQLGMTQLDLAGKLGVTDKAVSKWERDLSCPDIHSLPVLAEVLGVTVEDLMQGNQDRDTKTKPAGRIVRTICVAVALAMGIAVAVLSILDALEFRSAAGMLGIGLACLALTALESIRE